MKRKKDEMDSNDTFFVVFSFVELAFHSIIHFIGSAWVSFSLFRSKVHPLVLVEHSAITFCSVSLYIGDDRCDCLDILSSCFHCF